MWSVAGKITVLAMYKSTCQCKIADLGMVLNSGQGESQWLDQVGDSGISGQAVSEKITLPSISVSFLHSVPRLLFLLLFCFIFFHFKTLKQRLKTSAQLFSTQVAWPFYDLFSVLRCLVSRFLLLHSTPVSREFLSLFIIAVHVRGAKFSIRTINH